MKKLFIVIFLFFGSQEIFSAGGAPCGDYGECDSFKPELENIESLQLQFLEPEFGGTSSKERRE